MGSITTSLVETDVVLLCRFSYPPSPGIGPEADIFLAWCEVGGIDTHTKRV